MTLSEQALLFLAEQQSEKSRWGKPVSLSVVSHALGLAFLPWLWQLSLRTPQPLQIMEINVLSHEDLNLAGRAQDPASGPSNDKAAAVAQAPAGPVAAGNTLKVSNSLARASAASAKLVPSGPVFGSRSASAGAAAGIGREKIYVAASALRSHAAGRHVPAGDGLVGTGGSPINLNAKRGGGGAPGSKTGSYVMGGMGSIGGGSALKRRGESILADYPAVSEDMISSKRESMELPDPPDTVFSIRGPLSRRKLVKIKLPKYPRWAEEAGIEARISVRITVTPDGRVNTDVSVEQRSGYPEFDRLAVESARTMVFRPLPADLVPHEQWGVATFNFRLSNLSVEENL